MAERVGILGATSPVGIGLCSALAGAGANVVAYSRRAAADLADGIEWRRLGMASTGENVPIDEWVCVAPIWVLPEHFALLEASGARVSVVELTTAGSPCRVKLSLVHASASETYSTRYSSPDQLTPHTGIFTTILATADRGLTYDLYWSWTSGNESAGPTLVAAAAVYVPLTGEGDYPAEA